MDHGAGRRVRSGEVWARARGDFLAGLSAREVCVRHDLGLSALKARARREGWRRSDQADPPPIRDLGYDPELAEDLDEELEAETPADVGDMAGRALLLARRALALGRLGEAQGWTGVWRRLGGRPRADAEADARRAQLALEAQSARTDAAHAHAALALQKARSALTELADAAPVYPVHPVHPVHPGTSETEAPTTPEAQTPLATLNRHARRRQRRLAALKANHEAGPGP